MPLAMRSRSCLGTQGEALELEHLGALLREGLGHGLRLVVDPGLVEEDAAALREEALVHHPVDDLLARLLGLRLHLVRARVDLALGGHDVFGHVLARDPARLRPRDVHGEPAAEVGRAAADVYDRADLVRGWVDVGGDRRAVDRDEVRGAGDRDVLAQLRDELDALVLEPLRRPDALGVHDLEHLPGEGLELVVARHRLGLAADGDERPVVVLDAVADEALRRRAAGALAGLGHALLAQEALCGLEVAACLLERALAVHHPRAGLVAELLHELCGDLGHSAASSCSVAWGSGCGSRPAPDPPPGPPPRAPRSYSPSTPPSPP